MTYNKDTIVFLPKPTSHRFKDIEGLTFGRLTVLGIIARRGKKNTILWLCECSCGGFAKTPADSLQTGITQSCGCYRKERQQTHRLSRMPEYKVWSVMKDRCYNPQNPRYRLYGARGITVCARWRESVVHFIVDMGNRPKGGTLERIDNDKGYFPENCKWSSQMEQCNNRRGNVSATLNGKTQTIAQWYRELHPTIGLAAIYSRIRRGISPEQALAI